MKKGRDDNERRERKSGRMMEKQKENQEQWTEREEERVKRKAEVLHFSSPTYLNMLQKEAKYPLMSRPLSLPPSLPPFETFSKLLSKRLTLEEERPFPLLHTIYHPHYPLPIPLPFLPLLHQIRKVIHLTLLL